MFAARCVGHSVVFKPAPTTDDGIWMIIGIFIAIVGLLFASVGSMLRRKQI